MMRAVVISGLFALSGCSGLLHSSAALEQVYFLRAKATEETGDPRPPIAASIHVGRPVAGPGLDSSHILLLEPDRRMSYYTASRWPAPLPEVVEDLASQVLRASGSWSNVQSSESPFPSDYLLQIHIRRFEADYSTAGVKGGGRAVAGSGPAAPEVRVILDCTIGKRSGREVVATFVAEGHAVAAANRLNAVVAAFEEATNVALFSLSSHTEEAVGAAGQKVDNPVPSITR